MKHQIQTFPSLTIEPLPNGLFRLEDPAFSDGTAVDLHPVHVQVLAQMIGRPMPDATRAALATVHKRVTGLRAHADGLHRMLTSGNGVSAETVSAGLMVDRLRELAEDLSDLVDLCTPALESTLDAPANPGGQLTVDL